MDDEAALVDFGVIRSDPDSGVQALLTPFAVPWARRSVA